MGDLGPDLWSEGAQRRMGNAGAISKNWWSRLVVGSKSLKTRLTLAAISGMAVGIAVISFLSLTQVQSDLIAQTQGRELGRTVAIARDLSQRIVLLQTGLASTAEQLDLTGRNAEAIEGQLQAQPALLQQFANLFVAAADGQMLLMVDEAGPRRPRISLADRDYFRKVLAERRSVVSEAIAGRISGEPVIVIAHPIVRGGEVLAVVGGAIRLKSRSMAASLLDPGSGEEDGELLVITDESGQLIAHPLGDLVLKRVSAESRLAEAFKDWESRGSPAEPTGLLLRQTGEIVTAAGVAGTGWVVWRTIPQASLLEPLRAARWQAARNAALVIALSSILTFMLVARLLRPLSRLEERAQHLFDADRSIHEGWPDDVGEVRSLAHVLRHVGAERAHLESFTDEVLGRLNSVMAAAPVGIGFTRHQRFELINPTWCRMLLRDESEVLGRRAAEIFASEADYEQLGPLVQHAFAHSGAYVGEWRFRRKDGTVFWGQLSGRPVARDDPAAGTIWTLADVTDIRMSRENLEWSATHDPLTGLANRAAFEARIQAVFGHPPAALVVIDLDRFKPINDIHGHAAGDAMLKTVAAALSAHVRAGDLAVRSGGDEFAVVLERCPPEAAQRVAADIQRAITRAELSWHGQILTVGASVGVCTLSDELASTEDWIAAADEACYAAKAAGRGTVRIARVGSSNVIELSRQDSA